MEVAHNLGVSLDSESCSKSHYEKVYVAKKTEVLFKLDMVS